MAFKSKDIKSMIAHLTNPTDVASLIRDQKRAELIKQKIREQVKDGGLNHPKKYGYIREVLSDDFPEIIDMSDNDIESYIFDEGEKK